MSAFAPTAVAPCKWAQRSESVYLTISLADVKDQTIELTSDKLSFTGTSNGKVYTLNFEFFKEIETEGSIFNVLPQSVQMKLIKKEADGEFWPRLLKDKLLEKTNVTIDWDRYVDEDEQNGDFSTENLEGGNEFGGGGGGPPGGMGGMGGMGGPGGPGGGMGGMDMQKMLAQMQGGGGMGGAGGMDMASMMAGMGGAGGMGGGMGGPPGDYEDEEDGDSDDGELPDLETTEEA